MSQDRILGSMTTIATYTATGPVQFAELDSFTAKSQNELKKWRPLGQIQPHAQTVYDGYELSFKLGKVDNSVDLLQLSIDSALLAGNSAPKFRIMQTVNHFDGTSEEWQYDNVSLHGFSVDAAMSNEEVKHEISGFAPTRIRPGGNPSQGILNTGGNLASI